MLRRQREVATSTHKEQFSYQCHDLRCSAGPVVDRGRVSEWLNIEHGAIAV